MDIEIDAEVEAIAAWLRTQAAAVSVTAKPHPELARREQNWIYLPVRIEGTMGAFERAEQLQDLEDRWEDENSDSTSSRLVLIPAAA